MNYLRSLALLVALVLVLSTTHDFISRELILTLSVTLGACRAFRSAEAALACYVRNCITLRLGDTFCALAGVPGIGRGRSCKRL